MIHQGRRRQADLSDDLRPHVQRGKSVLPVFEDEKRPRIVGHDWLTYREVEI